MKNILFPLTLLLAMMPLQGYANPIETEKAKLLEELAQEGIIDANMHLSEMLLNSPELGQALQDKRPGTYLGAAAASGHKRALRWLAFLNINLGESQAKTNEGIRLLAVASLLGDDKAKTELIQLPHLYSIDHAQISDAYIKAAHDVYKRQIINCDLLDGKCPDMEVLRPSLDYHEHVKIQQILETPDQFSEGSTLLEKLEQELKDFSLFSERRVQRHRQQLRSKQYAVHDQNELNHEYTHPLADYSISDIQGDRRQMHARTAQHYQQLQAKQLLPSQQKHLEEIVEKINRHRKPEDKIQLDEVLDLIRHDEH